MINKYIYKGFTKRKSKILKKQKNKNFLRKGVKVLSKLYTPNGKLTSLKTGKLTL